VDPYPIAVDTFIDGIQGEVDAISQGVRDHFGALAAEQLAWRPDPERWGIGHCLVHLARINELYRERLTPALRRARARGFTARAPLRGSWVGRWFARAVGPGGRAVRTPPAFRPRGETVEGSALETFFGEQVRLQTLLDSARGLDLDRVRVTSPATRLIRLHACDVFRVLVEHEKRHVAQAERVLASPGFPTLPERAEGDGAVTIR
jgi:hypothetical protein